MRRIIIALLLFNSIFSHSQDSTEPIDTRLLNSIYVNLLGDASIISINYERLLIASPNSFFSSKLGIGYNEEFELCIFGPCSDQKKFLTIPHHFTVNFGKGKHFFEFGFGGTGIIGNPNQPYVFYPMVGYRLLPKQSKKLHFRIYGQIPLGEDDRILFIPIGVSLGRSF